MIDMNREYSRLDQLDGLPRMEGLDRNGYDAVIEAAELSQILQAHEARRLARLAFEERMKPWATTALVLALMASVYAIVLLVLS